MEETEAELVVIGAGAAGLSAAVAAAEKGIKKIVILETRGVSGGNAKFVKGIFAAESSLQKRLGIDARRDLLFRKAMDYGHWKPNPMLVRALIDKSGDTIEWLEGKGMEFDWIPPLYQGQDPLVFHFQKAPGETGPTFVRTFVQRCGDLGVRLFLKTRAQRLMTDSNGQITGVLAENKDKQLKITTKTVIVSTGGFAGNQELLKRYLLSYDEKEIHLAGIPHNGDGIQIAGEAGAATEGMDVLEMNGPAAFPLSSDLSPVVKHPKTMWVNKKGVRFTDEALTLFPESANRLYQQPGRISYTLFDENIKKSIFKENPSDAPLIRRVRADKAEEELYAQVEKGRVKIADSWDAIAEWIGIDSPTLKTEIGNYNTFCENGHDKIFVKDPNFLFPLNTPPYYAIQAGLYLLVTHGGIKINHETEVLDLQNEPIPGLYAAGVETGGADANSYNAQLAGHSCGFSVSSGRIAGENAAGFVKNN
ncbi:MAG: FAD-dependent oxidoreductase [Desulfobacteraceae bacterium]|nr:FAD-dependent oxidoreductase [Desulfobacteraceae bacterium]